MSRETSLSARWLLPVEGPPIPDGFVRISEGRIREVGPRRGREVDFDFGNAAIVPGFINAHTHLELEPFDGPASADGTEDQISWLKRVIAHRRGTTPEMLREQAGRGLEMAIASGTTALADITTAGASWGAISASPVRAVVYAEILGLRRMRGLEMCQAAWDWLGSIGPMAQVKANCRVGLSPHAPYSTAGWIYRQAAGAGLPLSTHLAEMPEEREFLRTGNGRLREFLEDLGAWDEEFEPIGPSPADYVRQGDLRKADWLIAHGNVFEPDEFWQFLPKSAPSGQRVAIAYCPRTHARFGHPPHPYLELLARGAIVCIGTDSLASSPNLSVLDEIRFLRRRDPRADGKLLLAMATIFGAWALRAETVTGSIKFGKSADLAVVRLPDRDAEDPHELLLEGDGPVLATLLEGQFHTPAR